jgi:dihydroneopterin aldolase
MYDEIIIEQLELQCHIGITDEERSVPQRLTVSLVLVPIRDFTALRDDIRNAVDYFKVAAVVRRLAETGTRRLIETLGNEIAEGVLQQFAVSAVELHLRKYIMPETASVGIRLRRERSATANRRAV